MHTYEAAVNLNITKYSGYVSKGKKHKTKTKLFIRPIL